MAKPLALDNLLIPCLPLEAPKEIIILRDDIINKQRAKKSLQKSCLEPLSTHMPTPQMT
jgi:hypothetical protein